MIDRLFFILSWAGVFRVYGSVGLFCAAASFGLWPPFDPRKMPSSLAVGGLAGLAFVGGCLIVVVFSYIVFGDISLWVN